MKGMNLRPIWAGGGPVVRALRRVGAVAADIAAPAVSQDVVYLGLRCTMVEDSTLTESDGIICVHPQAGGLQGEVGQVAGVPQAAPLRAGEGVRGGGECQPADPDKALWGEVTIPEEA